MKKKQIKHYVPERSDLGKWGYPACYCYKNGILGYLVALRNEAVFIRRGVTCKNCRRTRVFRKLK